MTTMKKLLREPLVHFLVLGFLFFVWFEWKGGGSGPGSTRISITPGLVEHLASGFAKTWQRPPTNAELKGLIDDHVKEEIATREAVAMGLDKDDTIIRRRLRQKIEFLVEDALDQIPPTDADLQAWMGKHPEAFRTEARVALRQVYVNTERRGRTALSDAKALLARLRTASPDAKIDNFGDSSMLPRELPLGPLSEVARAFGAEFAARIDAVPPGEWTGPIESPYGLHLVLVPERVAAGQPDLVDVRPIVEREFLSERRRMQLQALYEKLLAKYTVAIEMPKEPEKKQPASTKGGG
jgi:parvulin-like peptidyl-prolyl isomerase